MLHSERTLIKLLYILNTDKLKKVITPLYSETGRPSINQPEIFRSFVAMSELGMKLDEWLKKLENNAVLRAAIGVSKEDIPSSSSHYDFINRIIKMDERPKLRLKKRKPSNKLGKNEKLPNKSDGIVKRFVDKILCGRRFTMRPERHLQEIFANVCVGTSRELGLIPDNLDASGDGTCIETGASHYGRKICECKGFRCDCPRRFSDPNATWGRDSHNDCWFYGYTGYFISTYNKDLKTDLPLYLRLVCGNRHDSVSAVVALAEFRDLYPDLNIETFIHDSAADNYATYELLHNWNINAVIALNNRSKGNFSYPPALSIDNNGTPVCQAGHKMIYNGFCSDRCRFKWRCPRVLGKAASSDICSTCSKSEYGRVIYTKPDWDLRLFTRIPRGSLHFKSLFKQPTAAERINYRILNHYNLQNTHSRRKKRISFFATLAAINVHLDAWISLCHAQIASLFNAIFHFYFSRSLF